jgi:hypothetical protein
LAPNQPQASSIVLDQPNRLEAVDSMNVCTRPIIMIKMRRKVVVVMVIHSRLMSRRHMEIVLGRDARTGN